MGILAKFNNEGSLLQGEATATNNPTSVASTTDSKLHGTFDGDFGYSTAGFYFDEVNAQWQAYNDDMPNPLPSPSTLDMGTTTPTPYLDTFVLAEN